MPITLITGHADTREPDLALSRVGARTHDFSFVAHQFRSALLHRSPGRRAFFLVKDQRFLQFSGIAQDRDLAKRGHVPANIRSQLIQQTPFLSIQKRLDFCDQSQRVLFLLSVIGLGSGGGLGVPLKPIEQDSALAGAHNIGRRLQVARQRKFLGCRPRGRMQFPADGSDGIQRRTSSSQYQPPAS